MPTGFTLGALLLENSDPSGWSPWALSALGGAAGLVLGVLLHLAVTRSGGKKIRAEAARALAQAEAQAQEIKRQAELSAKDETLRLREEFEKEKVDAQRDLKQKEKRLEQKEENLERRLDATSKKESMAEEARRRYEALSEEGKAKQQELDALAGRQLETLHELARLTPDQARTALFERLETELATDCAALIRKQVEAAREGAETEAREVLLASIQRLCTSHTADTTVSIVDLPDDALKGRIIGREGRNIRAFERETGVDVIIDDTPGVVVVSAFDMVRREVAARSLRKMIEDGRIHPGRIEEVTAQMRSEVEKDIVETGKQSLFDLGIHNVHPKLQYLVGRMKYRASYGQSLLLHATEVAFLCKHMAEELHLDPELALRCGFLHDLGKTVEHEHDGGHPAVGAEFLRKYREGPEVVEAAAGHHLDFPAQYPYTILAHVGDAISASRPGARRESIDNYVKRLERLEAVAVSHQGVTAAFAVQAGREVRVIVDADTVDDAQAIVIARKIAQQIEDELTYPGEVRVTLLRERRITEYAR